ncbi:hypothetical protein BC628DRAFT_5125 [Trametes gibbosa]|nr:hypothetical protein BC628DRAFT_5125 [Trametes gibbosa]
MSVVLPCRSAWLVVLAYACPSPDVCASAPQSEAVVDSATSYWMKRESQHTALCAGCSSAPIAASDNEPSLWSAQ